MFFKCVHAYNQVQSALNGIQEDMFENMIKSYKYEFVSRAHKYHISD